MPELSFLVDADMPRAALEALLARGYDAQDVRDIGLGGATDEAIIAHALTHGLVVVTRDTDFGEVLRYPNHPGAIILRLPSTTRASDVAAHLGAFLDTVKGGAIVGAITIVEPGRYRRRPLR